MQIPMVFVAHTNTRFSLVDNTKLTSSSFFSLSLLTSRILF